MSGLCRDKSDPLFVKTQQKMREDICFDEAANCGVGRAEMGKGQVLFALKDFSIGETVADYSISSQKWSRVPFSAVPRTHKEICWWVGESLETAILAPPGSLFIRANHSRAPNTAWNLRNMRAFF